MKASPTSPELGDLGLVDAFFKGVYVLGGGYVVDGIPIPRVAFNKILAKICGPAAAPSPLDDWFWYHGSGVSIIREGQIAVRSCGNGGGTVITIADMAKNPFYCPSKPSLPDKLSSGDPGDFFFGDKVGFYNLSTYVLWSDMKPIVLNILNLEKLISVYPFPLMWNGSVGSAFWWSIERLGLRELVRQPGILTQDIARLWVTLSIVRDWPRIADYMASELRREARDARFAAMIQAVAFTAIGIIASIAMAPLIAKGFAAAGAVISAQQKRDAASGLSEAADRLKASDPAFAGQVQWAAEFIKRLETGVVPAVPSSAQGGGIAAVVGIGVPTLLSIGISLLGKK